MVEPQNAVVRKVQRMGCIVIDDPVSGTLLVVPTDGHVRRRCASPPPCGPDLSTDS